MIEAYRVVEDQRRSYSYEATADAEQASYLDLVLEESKPPLLYSEWHVLIAAPFRYPLPVRPAYEARFKPPYSGRNVLYCSRATLTALHEHAFHFLRQRVGREGTAPETGQRTIFSVFVKEDDVTDISGHPEIRRIMDRVQYAPSHEYIRRHSEVKVISYPSCRDPGRGMNYAARDIESLGKDIGEKKTIEFYFDPRSVSIRWIGHELDIDWATVGEPLA